MSVMSMTGRAIAMVVALCGACGGSTSSGSTAVDGGSPDGSTPDGGGSDSATGTDSASNPVAVPRAIARMNGGAAAGCVTVPPFTVGDFGDTTAGGPAKPVEDGGDQGGKSVAISCRVAPNAAGGWELAGSIAIAGDTSFTIAATLDAQGKTSAASFTLKKATAWSSMKCNLDPSSLPQGAVAAGRYWTRLFCGGSTSDTGQTCDIFGELRLENCAQL